MKPFKDFLIENYQTIYRGDKHANIETKLIEVD